MTPLGGSSGLEKERELPPSVFKNLEEATDEVRIQLAASSQPVVHRRLVDALLWLKSAQTQESRKLLDEIREKWIAPYAMDQGPAFATALELSDILGDRQYAESVYRSLVLEEAALPSSVLPRALVGEVRDEPGVSGVRAKEVLSNDASPALYGLDELGGSVSEEASLLRERIARHGMPKTPAVPYPSPRYVEHDSEVLAYRAEVSISYIRTLARLRRPVAFNVTLLRHTVALLEGGPVWVDQLRKNAAPILAKMSAEDAEKFTHVLSSSEYARQLLEVYSASSPLSEVLPQPPVIPREYATAMSEPRTVSRVFSAVRSWSRGRAA